MLQFYAQPFETRGRYDRYQQLIAARAADPRAQFMPVDPFGPGLSPDGTDRTLNGNVVLRWEYRPGSVFTAVWNHQRDSALLTPTTNVFLIKTSFRLGA